MNNVRHLVLSGGAYLGFSELGALAKCSLSWKDIETYDATSIGAIFSVLFSLSFSVNDVLEYFVNRPWGDLLKDMYPSFSMDNITSTLQQCGLLDERFIQILMEPFLTMHFPEHRQAMFSTLTLQTLYEYTGKEVYMYTVRMPNKSSQIELVSVSHVSHPNLPVLTALRMTTAVPILFQPVYYQEEYYIDGGVLSNYPLEQCIQRGNDPRHILSIYLKTVKSSVTDGDTEPSPYALFEFQYDLVYRMIYHMRSMYETVKIPNELIILCEHMSIQDGLNQLNSKKAREHMVEKGEQSAILFLEYHERYTLHAQEQDTQDTQDNNTPNNQDTAHN